MPNTPSSQPWPIFLACIVAAMTVEFSSGALNLSVRFISSEFETHPTTLQLVVIRSKLLLSALMLAGGALGDLYGHKRLLWIGSCGVALAALLCMIAASVQTILVARALDGVFAALVSPLSLAVIAVVFDQKTRALAIAMYIAFLGLGNAVGPLASVLLMQSLGWRAAFLAPAACGVVGAISVWIIVPRSPASSEERRLDFAGTIGWALGLAGLVFGIIECNRFGWSSPMIWVSLVIGVAGLVSFCGGSSKFPTRCLTPRCLAIRRSRSRYQSASFSRDCARRKPLAFVLFSGHPGKQSGARVAANDVLDADHGFTGPPGWSSCGQVEGGDREERRPLRHGNGGRGLVVRAAGNAICLGGSAANAGRSGEPRNHDLRTSVVINAAPATASGAASAINAATVSLWSTLGNRLVSTLFFAVARKDYFQQMSATGMSLEQIRKVTAVWRKAVNQSIAVDSSVISEDLVKQLRARFHHALAVVSIKPCFLSV